MRLASGQLRKLGFRFGISSPEFPVEASGVARGFCPELADLRLRVSSNLKFSCRGKLSDVVQ